MKVEKRDKEYYEISPWTKVKKEIEVYITEDGQEFEDKAKAELHERRLQIPTKSFYLVCETSGKFHYITKVEDIILLGYEYYIKRGQLKVEDMALPGWFLFSEVSAPNGDFLTVETLESVRESLMDSINELPSDNNMK